MLKFFYYEGASSPRKVELIMHFIPSRYPSKANIALGFQRDARTIKAVQTEHLFLIYFDKSTIPIQQI
jgi:hypothetical protein